jgi:hypothetical protein
MTALLFKEQNDDLTVQFNNARSYTYVSAIMSSVNHTAVEH